MADVGAPVACNADDSASADPASTTTYVVRPGDMLWSIAERAYGSCEDYRRLVDANLGRSMPDGDVFSARGVIKPGWRLVAPDATWGIEEINGEQLYEVRPCDSLSSIAGAVLDDSSRWPEVFDLNRGARTTDGVHVLNDANTIWPGLSLRLPSHAADDETSGSDSDPGPVNDSAPVELLAAAAPTQNPTLPTFEPTPDQADAPDPTPMPLPLVRTPHAFQPVVLDPADAAPVPTSPSDASEAAPASAPNVVPPVSQLPVAPLVLGSLGLAGLAGLAIGASRRRRRPATYRTRE